MKGVERQLVDGHNTIPFEPLALFINVHGCMNLALTVVAAQRRVSLFLTCCLCCKFLKKRMQPLIWNKCKNKQKCINMFKTSLLVVLVDAQATHRLGVVNLMSIDSMLVSGSH